MNETAKALFDGESAIKKDVDREGDTLFIIFGGISQGIGLPRFEFYKITQSLPAKLVFIRDIHQGWYHLALPGIGTGISDVCNAIRRIEVESATKKTVCVGNSMGGYAALLVGSLVRADEVISFSPQTFIGRWLRIRYGDSRWKEQIKKVYGSPSSMHNAFDLSRLLADPGYAKATIFADPKHRLDFVHAKRMEKLPGTKVQWTDGGHNLVKKLRDAGDLENTLIASCLPKLENKVSVQ